MKYIILLSILFSTSAYSAEVCTIKTFKKIYYLPSASSPIKGKIIKSSNCPSIVTKKFKEHIFYSSGTFTQRALNNIESIKKTKMSVRLSPKRVNIINLKDKLKDHFDLGAKWSFDNLKMLNKNNIFGLNQEDSLDIGCEFCHTTGKKNISLTIFNALSNYNKTHWVNATVFVSTKVLVSSRSISPSEPRLMPQDFVFKEINVTRPEKYFTNKSKLTFYKINKPLAQGSGLAFSYLSPINLVSAGIQTQVILRNKLLIVEGKGIPSQSGKFGETISLRNPKTKKAFSAKVIDFNKVLVDL